MNLEDVKVGDKLMTTSGKTMSNKKTISIDIVERITKTQIVLTRGKKVKRDTGKEIGSGTQWSTSYWWVKHDEKVVKDIMKHNFNCDVDNAERDLKKYGFFKIDILSELIKRLNNEN